MVSNSEIMVTETENFKELTKVEETTTFKEEQDSKVSITNFEKTEIDFNESKAKVESYNNANIKDEVDSSLQVSKVTAINEPQLKNNYSEATKSDVVEVTTKDPAPHLADSVSVMEQPISEI